MQLDEKIINILNEHNINPTRQRQTILRYLYENEDHPSAEIIYYDLKERESHISRATVYNVLNLFEKEGIAKVISVNENIKYYDVDFSEHAHFVCDSCGGIFDCDLPNIFNKHAAFKIPREASIRSLDILVHGICSQCNIRQEEV